MSMKVVPSPTPSRAHVIVTLWHQVPRASISVGQMRDCMQEWWSQMVSDEGVARWCVMRVWPDGV